MSDGSMKAEDKLGPILLAVMSNTIETICREMSHTLLRSARSSVLATGRDASCAIVTSGNEMIGSAESLPVHVIGSGRLAETMQDLHPDFSEGDAFLHNDPYRGNTHPADHCILVPVFHEDGHLFTVVVVGHQADIGNAQPVALMPRARDVYEEGALIFPCVRVQKDYTDVDDIIRMCRARIRAPDIWYGDYLAAVGAARVGERSLQEFIRKYGKERIRAFCREWLDYSEHRMVRAIRELPDGHYQASSQHDPLPGLPDGVPLAVSIEVDGSAGLIEVDLRGNPDSVKAGINQSETTARGSAVAGVFNSIDPSIPHNAGSVRRIRVLLRENCVTGIPRHPTSTSMATSNVTDRVINLVQRSFAEALPDAGAAEGSVGIPVSHSMVWGQDSESDDGIFVTHLLVGAAGGPGTPTGDGWLSYILPCIAGLLFRDSVEVLEQKYPLVIHESMLLCDSEGPGRWCGANGAVVAFGPRHEAMTAVFTNDGYLTPARGVRGGGDASGHRATLVRADGAEVPLTGSYHEVEILPGERLRGFTSGGAGYGNPLERSPSQVLVDVERGYISVDRARDVYGVSIKADPMQAAPTLDEAQTRRLRG